jgi:hypothetical protein
MALRVDQEKLVKYADKAFLALALVFLIFAVLMLTLSGKTPPVTYGRVKIAYDEALRHRGEAEKNIDKLLADDPATLALVTKQPEYALAFTTSQETRPPVWANQDEWAPYKAIVPAAGKPTVVVRVPVLDNEDPASNRRVAPQYLAVTQGRAYIPTGKESQGNLGEDILYVSGQAIVPVWQQTLWSREAANADAPENPAWRDRIRNTWLTDYEVQRREKTPDGNWTDWQTIKTVRYDDVRTPPLPFRRCRDGDAKVLNRDDKARNKFIEDVRNFLQGVNKYQKDILQPPFYKLAGKEWASPYDLLGEPERQPAAGPAAEAEPAAPVGGGGQLPAALQPAATPATAKTTKAQPQRGTETQVWFNDKLSMSDIGKTFQYRVRVKFFNPVFNADPGDLDPKHLDEGWMVELPGAWSKPSDPITIEPVVRFFFVGRFGNKANFKLYRWTFGRWYQIPNQAFEVGDAISVEKQLDIEIPDARGVVRLPKKQLVQFNSGATMVDVFDATVRYGGAERRTEEMIYQDQLKNELGSRISVIDKDDAAKFWADAQTVEARVQKRPTRPTGPTPPPEEPVPTPFPEQFPLPGDLSAPVP